MNVLFVYNVNSGLMNALKDTFLKTFSPNKVQCNLCNVTFGKFGVKNEWKTFIDSLEHDIEFLHRDEFVEKYGDLKNDTPCAYKKENGTLELIISSEEINKVENLEQMKDLVRSKL